MPLVQPPELTEKVSLESWIFGFSSTFDRLVSVLKAVLGFCGGFQRFWGLFFDPREKVEKNEEPDSFRVGKIGCFFAPVFS